MFASIKRITPLGVAILLMAWTSHCHAVVTADWFGTHQTTPGQPAFGVNVDGVSELLTFDVNGNSLGTCTAADTGNGGIITAGHCLSNPNIASATVQYNVPGLASYSAPLANWAVHPAFNNVPGTGYDIAVANLFGPHYPVPSYNIYRGNAGSEVGDDVVVVGYGRAGFGGFLGDIIGAGTKRAGENTINALGLSGPQYAVDSDLDGLARADQQLTYDFDSGFANQDGFARLFGHAADTGHGDDEVGTAPGDSGGPSFAMIGGEWQIVGVHSYGMRLATDAGITSDVDGGLNSTFGEFFVDTRLASPAIHRFVDHYFDFGTSGDILGDLNSNGDIDGADIDLIFDNVIDLDGNGIANSADIDFLVEDLSGTAFGDVNLDRDVDFDDFLVLANNFGQTNRTWGQGDFNGDGAVDFGDYLMLSANFGFDETIGIGSSTANFQMTAVPEPDSRILLFALLPLVLQMRRRRKNS